jgi:spermidine/putrescine transport system permease protein
MRRRRNNEMSDKGRSAKTLRRRLLPYGLLAPGVIWLVVFFVVPMYFMGEMSLRSGVPNTPEGFTFSWDFSNYTEALAGRGEQIVRTFFYAGTATIIALLIAYPLAYAIALKVNPRWRLPLLFAVIAPFFTTYLIRTIAWETILSDQSPVIGVLQTIGLVADNGHVLATGPAVIAGLTYNFLPFMVLPLYASLERIDASLIEAAKDLYSSAWAAFRRVTLPLSMPGIVAGTLLTFIPAAGDYVNAFFLGGANNKMIGNTIQGLYLNQRDYPTAAALSFVLMALIMVAFLIYIRFAGSEALMGEEAEPA